MNASVVVPLYNNELYIERCITSILNQTYKDFELIIIDDGSTDNSLQICKKYESEKVHIFTKKNGGPSSARNFGISKCSQQSKYLFFIDSDDTVSVNYLSSMLSGMTDNCCVICGINHINESELTNNGIEHHESANSYRTIEHLWDNELFYELLPTGIFNSSCNKCYSLKLIRRYNLRFADSFPEDIRFNLNYFENCNKITISDTKLYNYIHRDGSVTKKPFRSLFDNYIEIQQFLYSKAPKKFHNYIGEFVYPQYLGSTKLFLLNGNREIPALYLKNKYIRRAIRQHKSTCPGDALVKYSFRFGLLSQLLRWI